MIVLDTQHVSQLQRIASGDAARLEVRLPASEAWITIITPFEQLRACLGKINKARNGDQVTFFDLLHRLLGCYATE